MGDRVEFITFGSAHRERGVAGLMLVAATGQTVAAPSAVAERRAAIRFNCFEAAGHPAERTGAPFLGRREVIKNKR
jgi:hypothetical protein